MKGLVVGCGSIGRRHLKNLRALGVETLAYDPQADRLEQAGAQCGARPCAGFEEGLKAGADFVVVATPNRFHLDYAVVAAKAGRHLFIEKPLSDSLEGLETLESEAASRGLTVLVGCNMRFHPGVALAKSLALKGAIGRLIGARAVCASYLPDWHPGEDYRKGYSARKDLGGGVILDAIHEIDYMLDIMGAPDSLSCQAGQFGDLGIETEDTADIALTFSSGALGSIHLDYVQRRYTRGLTITGTEGTIDWDWQRQDVRLFKAGASDWTVLPVPFPDVNAMYVDEMRHFLDCIATGRRPAQGLSAARLALEVALAAKESAAQGRRLSFKPRKTVAVIQARLGSSRLPGKVLKPIAGGKTVLERMIARVGRARSLDSVVVATSQAPADEAVAQAALAAGADVFRGSEQDVLDRMRGAARRAGAATIVRLTADCPLSDPAVIDRVVERFLESGADYAATASSYPDGFDVEVLSAAALETAWREATLPSDREHVCPFIWKQPQRFKVVKVEYERDLSAMRLTVDEPADFEVVEKVFAGLGADYPFTIGQAVAWLEAHPQVSRLNAHIGRNEGYAASLKKDAG